jgi:predicted phage tail component-like protein
MIIDNTMIGGFEFNTIESASFKLVCKSVKRRLLPALKVKRIDLPGTSGVYDFDDNEYSLSVLTMKIQYIGTDYMELRTRARSIAAWLSTSTWAKLILNDEPDKYYLAKVTGEIDLQTLWESGTADITFDCQPFAYSLIEQILVVPLALVPTIYEFVNPGTRLINYKSPQGSKFKMEVVGTFTTLTLAMNGRTLNYTQASNGTVTIDNVEMEAVLGAVNKFSVLSGDIETFLSVVPGNNTLSIGGTDLNITITIKYIPLWM